MTSMMPEPQMPVTPVDGRCLGEARLVRPEVAADDLVARLQRVADRCGCARSRPARRAGRRRSARPRRPGRSGEEQASSRVAVAQHDLGVGADIDQQRQLVLEVRRLRQHDAGGVGADMAGDAGQRCTPCAPG